MSQNAPTLKRYSTKLQFTTIDFDEIWLKCSQHSTIEFACFSFHVGLLFFINFSSFKPDTENNANVDAVSSKRANFDEVQDFKTKHTPKLIIFGTHNPHTFEHNTLINEL